MLGSLPHLRASFRGKDLAQKCAVCEPPLRSELFSRDQMKQHGKTLAGMHKLSPEHGPDQLLLRLAENEGILTGTRTLLMEAVTTDRRITPAGEWLLDNFYLIEEQIRTARRHLPKGYSRELPRLMNGLSAGLPRVYDLALETISHGDGRVDPENLSSFIAAYQTVSVLKLGELWAIPIMLRLALIENLRRVAARIAADRTTRNLADYWADQMTEMAERDPNSLILVIADMVRSDPPMVSSFVAEFTRRLQGQSPALALPLTWIEQRLSESGLTIEQSVHSENQQQAADQVSISNSINSLRFLGAMDWVEFVEKMSLVEQVLRQDPAGVYGMMDFATRDQYRHVVEKIAKSSLLSESEVALKAIGLAAAPQDNGQTANNRSAHVGFYLIDRGLLQLEQAAGLRRTASGYLKRISHAFPSPFYVGLIALITMFITGGIAGKAYAGGAHDWLLAVIGLLSLLGTSQLAVELVNWLATLLVTPRQLPRMDFSRGIPPESRTLVVIPTMLTSSQNIDDLTEALEVRFLANRDANLHFSLLTDFQDAPEETLPEDEPLLLLARQRIEELNNKYRSTKGDTFFLFHRPRRWNPQEQVWMGYERKRGKLADLNSLLRNRRSAHNDFSLIVGNTATLSGVKYVITLDTDTQLPRDAARQFAGTMAHPLNRAHYDKVKQRVIAGYGILQPRVGVSLPGTNRSRYARMNGSDPGIDPYTRAVSDVYQDLFGEGSFIGKGIYDVDAFEQALNGRFPENRILSHDLIEGCYARAGLLSDVMVYEDYPARYSADVSRRHRWIRGDWQLVRWLLPGVPGFDGQRQKNPLSLLSRWKLFDNLRRSLVPSALTVLLLLGWTMFPSDLSAPLFWTLTVLGIMFIPSLIGSAVDLLKKPHDLLISQHLAAVGRSAVRRVIQVIFTLACLPYEAFFSLDAILHTIWRMLITRRQLLEWSPSGDPDRSSHHFRIGGLADVYRTMWIAPFLAVAAILYLALASPAALEAAGPVLGLWFVSPGIAWWISRPLTRRRARLQPEQIIFLRKLSRKTWAFFETFVGPDDHWLPPDNYQEYRVATVAHRTSPTNMGLSLLANLSAYDFGYLSAGQFIERTENALRTMESMEHHRGHFYNWYDTQSLRPLLPTYISTVDSGNLAAHLLTLRAGLLALPDHKIQGAQVFEGLNDTFRILMDSMDSAEVISPKKSFQAGMTQLRKRLESACSTLPETLEAARLYLEQLTVSAAEVLDSLDAQNSNQTNNVDQAEPDKEVRWWADAFANQCRTALDDLMFLSEPAMDSSGPVPTLRELAGLGSRRANERIEAIEKLALQSAELSRMDYDFLFDPTRHLLAIGYNVAERRTDASFYDLLASEARLSCFVAIAQGQLPQESWFALGRLLTSAGGEPILLSWSGSMFEYLMPLLVMPTYEHTLLDQTYKAAVDRQIEYGKKRGVPWGISESGYNTVDVHLNYQYRAFGVPGLGLKRGLADDLVIAPYASALALMVAPEEACLNLQRLSVEGFEARYGMYEAVDYTPSRQRRREPNTVIRSFMAHHQGMSLLSLSHLLLSRPMQKRFESDPQFQATMLLLQERVPRVTAFYLETPDISDVRETFSGTEMPMRIFSSPNTPMPEVQLLSNGRYQAVVTNAGGGYSRWKDLSVTRWREDTTCDSWGTFCYLRDVASGKFWSTAYQPTLKRADTYEAIFTDARAEFRRRDFDYDMHTEIVVSPEDDIELRRTRITNSAKTRRTIDITSYAEVVVAPSASDALHPAFSNLFVQTEIIRGQRAILCTRRPRSLEEQTPWMFHLMTAHGAEIAEVSYETDRLKFIGRGRTVANPAAMSGRSTLSGALSGTEGSVLDPIVAIRYRITLEPEASATIDIVTGIGETRDASMGLVEKYQDRRFADRVFDLAWTHSQVLLRQLNVTESDAQLYGRLAGSIIYANSSLRADADLLKKNHRGQSGLWGYAISGDLPIVLLRIEDPANIDLVRQLVQAHAYWRLKGLTVDLVIWNEDHAGYRQLLQDQIMGLIAAGLEASVTDRPGGIFVRLAEQISNEDRILLQTVARIIISDKWGTLADQISRPGLVKTTLPRLRTTRTPRLEISPAVAMPRRDLIFFNELGGFSPDGREYIITTTRGQVTPAPWVNVLANPNFGTVISESGSAYTWSENAHEFRLTPWSNDPVCDSGGEAYYIRDEESGLFWSPSPLPSRGLAPYISRHGFGYSVFEHTEDGIRSEMWVYVAIDASIKFTVLKVRNESGRARRLSATGYVEWVLGDLQPKTRMHIITKVDSNTGALFALNPYNTEFADRTAFFDVADAARTVSGDRTEFLGRNGTLRNPEAMSRARLSGKVGAALDPCGAIHLPFDLTDGQEREFIFMLGAGRNADEAGKLVRRFRGPAAGRRALEAVWQYWNHTLGAVQVETPDQSVNVLANGWLLYQTMASRLWARSGYYQSGGAFGFRDQLQDVMALIHTEPRLVREQILLCAAHQFREGDVQHWWHPPSGRGVRTHCSDDFLWLPMAASRYVLSTGDTGVLDEPVRFIEGRPVGSEMDSYYDLPHASDETAPLYEHCVRAILHGLRLGGHGLPLIGSGDWNDGMNLVGEHGKGESVWLGFFLYDILTRFTAIAHLRDDVAFVGRCQEEAAKLRRNIEENGWDGEWYRRAYFDNGALLGSAGNAECRIDSIAQSWSVLSGAGNATRSRTAMESLDKRLVRRDHNLIQLLDPPFDRSDLNPGYIKGYVPGVRENGGQYTHAAIWAAMAFAQLGDSKRAWELVAMINPINHGNSLDKITTYKAEPYVVAADVYAVSPHIGRGGWSWYTGSSAWMYRLILESLLGLRLETDKLRFAPCLPADWESFKIHYRYRETVYHITVMQTHSRSAATVIVDGVEQSNLADNAITLLDDRQEHAVEVRIPANEDKGELPV
ncbi:MAG: cyclic beta 1-2 glucan synthetase [Nitrospirae bacterium]|nr:cyclic beta 1-2 glucan synthetase [Nitrospirota bacterium]